MSRLTHDRRRRDGSGGAKAWTPKNVTGLMLWLDSTYITGLNDGDLVSTWPDRSGNGYDATQSEAAKKPTYKTNIINGKPVVRFANAHGLVTPAINIGATGITIFVLIQQTTTTGTQMVTEFSENYNSHADACALFLDVNRPTFASSGNVQTSSVLIPACGTTGAVLLTAVGDKTLATHEADAWSNEYTNIHTWTLNGNNSNGYGNYVFNIGARNAASLYYRGDLVQVLVYKGALSLADRLLVQAYLHNTINPGYGITQNATADYEDNGYSTRSLQLDGEEFTHTSPGSRLIYTTDATSVDVDTYCERGSTFNNGNMAVRVNGVGGSTITPTKTGSEKFTVALGAGAGKTVELIGGLHAYESGYKVGTFITGASFNAAATISHPAYTDRLVVYGDSIAVGQGATNPAIQGWAQLVRKDYVGNSLVMEGASGLQLWDEGATAAARQVLADRIAAMSPDYIWIEIGTNDHTMHNWSSADFGTAYGDLLDKLNAALPAALIYTQTPIVKNDEAEKEAGFGDLPAYRAAIATEQGTRAAYCTLVDGTAILVLGDLSDGIHPSTAGHAKYAAAVKTILGI